MSRAARVKRFFLGDRPRALLVLLAPTALAIVVDVALRARSIASFALQGKAIWGSSLLVSAAFWALPLWLASRLRSRAAIGAAIAISLPFATFGFGGQVVHQWIFASYMGRDTLRLGMALRGDVGAWLVSWNQPLVSIGLVVAGVAVAYGLFRVVRRARDHTGVPALLVVTFGGAVFCFWTDNVDSRFLQAALPDACFVHGVVHAVRATAMREPRHGMSVRTPAPLPPLTSARDRALSVVLVVTESVRADAICSEASPHCKARFLDDVVPDRVALGKLTTQTPNTHSAFVMLATGLVPNAGFAASHTAPVLWEIAHALGRRTAFISSQNPKYEDFGLFVRRAGIDRIVTGTELGGVGQEHLGAPDERATDEALRFAREGGPYFMVVQLANTHWPYRVDPDLQPYVPHSEEPFRDVDANHNHYRNSVLLQERTLAAFLRELRALPSWSDTLVLFVSDHGEQFREHGASYHNHSFYDEEIRVPGFVAGGALDDAMRASLATWKRRRTYLGDVRATIVDLLGVDAAALPYAEMAPGRSLVRDATNAEPMALLATMTGVWDGDYPIFGVMNGERMIVGAPGHSWQCFDIARDPSETRPQPASACSEMRDVAEAAFTAPIR